MKSQLNPERLIRSRAALPTENLPDPLRTVSAAEGGCGVIGIASSVPIHGRHLLQSLRQMRNRGNGKGGGVAMVGLDPTMFGVAPETLQSHYALTVAYLDRDSRSEVEEESILPVFEVQHARPFDPSKTPEGHRPPYAVTYFVRPRGEVADRFADEHGLRDLQIERIEDELVYQNSYRLNTSYYASLGEKRAFVLSHGKDNLVLKMVGYGDDVIESYGLENATAHVWIGHHRYPTKGRVWHPGGAHPFVGLHESLVHNGDLANYASVCTYLAQSNIRPLFLTDTEVSVLVFDLLHRTYGYPLEYVIEALAPTTERDFAMLPQERQDIYRLLQTVHMHGSPDGPWFFLIAQSSQREAELREPRLIGITDTSMLRPQVFALQQGAPGEPSIGFAASEKQAIDAALESLAAEDPRFWTRPDRIWNARGGSHTDGGAFVFRVIRNSAAAAELVCEDKFGRRIEIGERAVPYRSNGTPPPSRPPELDWDLAPDELFDQAIQLMPGWTYPELCAFLDRLSEDSRSDAGRARALQVLSLLIDRRYPTGDLRRSSVVALCDQSLLRLFEAIAEAPSDGYGFHSPRAPVAGRADPSRTLLLDGRDFNIEGPGSLALEIVQVAREGWRRLLVSRASGHRFLGNGLGPESDGLRIDVYGASGDYAASGLDGAEMIIHGSAQDQLAQIMKRGRLVVHGDVGQTFMYAAKGGQAFVLGNAAGRPLINAVGRPRVVINGTCLDYLAESFMAGDPLNGGGFAVLNGVAFGPDGRLHDLSTPYPGGNLFSLASGGAIFVRDPRQLVGEDQLNGGQFARFDDAHWALIRPLLEENERLFGISVGRLLEVDGEQRAPDDVYRAIVPATLKVLQPEEAWVSHS